MTTEEVIAILHNMEYELSNQVGSKYCRKKYEAVRMVIKALEQEPSRDMEEIKEIMECDADTETKCKMISSILTAKPYYFEKQEPKTGHWIKSNIRGAKVCSVCNAHMGLSNFKFCPNCGAKMKEGN